MPGGRSWPRQVILTKKPSPEKVRGLSSANMKEWHSGGKCEKLSLVAAPRGLEDELKSDEEKWEMERERELSN